MWVFAFLPLGVWVWLQSQRIDALARRVAELELQLFALRAAPPAAAPHAEPAPQPTAPAGAPPREELLLTEVVPDDVLVLDNPLPEASNDTEAEPVPSQPAAMAPKPRMHSPLLLNEQDAVAAPPRPEPERAAAQPPVSKPKPPPRRLDLWLAEKGLAWVAGIALALGAIYLVSLAAQSVWFTAPMRLGAAATLGVLLLGVSEWTRRLGLSKPPGHPLVSSMLAGAAVVVFYATTWAAHGIYQFIDWPIAAALLLLCAAALIGLSFLHGQALGVLATGLALIAPSIASAQLWPSAALTAYVALVGAGGFAVAILKRWSWVAVTTIGGLYFWFFASITADDVRRALALVSFASVGGLLAAFRAPLEDDAKTGVSWSAVHGFGPSVAISVSSALLIWAWLVVAPSPTGLILGPALIGIFHLALATYAVRERKAAPATVVVAVSAIVIGFVAYLRSRFFYAGGPSIDFYPTVLLAAFCCAAATLFANPHRTGRALVAAAGAVGAGLLTLIAATSRPDWHSLGTWAPLFVGAVLLFVCAWYASRSAQDAKTDLAVTWWAGAGAAVVLLAIESSVPDDFRTLGHALAALLFSLGLVWRGWRVAGWAALTAGALAIAHALSPSLIEPTLAGTLPLWAGLLTFAGSAVQLFSASTVIRRSGANIPAAEALSAASVMVALVGVFVALRWIAAGGAGVALDDFTETSLRVLALMAAGLTLLPRIHETPGTIGAWRGHVLLGLGLLYALAAPGLGINPWWGGPGRTVVNGMPIFNVLALAFAAPAALAFLAANRLYTRQRLFARIYAIAGGVLALMWLVLEIRHAFHSGSMAAPEIGLFESSCYALAFLTFALAFAIVARVRSRRNLLRPFTEDLLHSMRTVSWGALAAAASVMLVWQHPIWGAHNSADSNAFSTMLAVLAQLAATGLALALGRALSRGKDTDPARFAAASAAALFAWSFGHSVIRWLHHRGYMDDGAAPYALEGFAHALWPLIFVIAAAQLTRLAPGRDTQRAYHYDLQAIWSAAIWPALGFAGLGLWLFYNPWWGSSPAELLAPVGAAIAFACYLAAAALSYVAPDVPRVRGMQWMVPTATVVCAIHLFVAFTILIRWIYHRDAMVTAPAGDLEQWTYSGVWAVFGGVTLWLGTVRNDPALRWVGLAALLAATVKVFFVDIGRLSGLALAGSAIGLGIVTAVTAWLVRRNRPPAAPGDLVTVTPSARRERRRVRRRNSP
jgi:uncharacterized membrane protein